MDNKLLVLAICLICTVFGCSSVPTKDIVVGSEAHPRAKFSGYRTYAWLGGATIVNDEHGRWEPMSFDADAEIKFLIDRELRDRGMSENSSSPDLIVGFAAGIDMDALDIHQDSKKDLAVIENVPKGSLLVILMDSETGLVIWAGTAVGDVHNNADATHVRARMEYAVKKLLMTLPSQ